MEKEIYEKPSMKFVSIRNEEAVANTCWGGHSGALAWNYDTSGTGYVSFQIMGGKCSLDGLTVTYHNIPEDKQKAAYDEMYAALMNSGGAQGNPFKGEGGDFPVNPDPSWS